MTRRCDKSPDPIRGKQPTAVSREEPVASRFMDAQDSLRCAARSPAASAQPSG